MAIGRDGGLGRGLRAVFGGGAAAGLGDGPLVDRLAAGGEPARSALAALVERHGAMVLRACRAGSRDPNDADDAFQAVFLVLARKAGSIRVGESLGPWLHGVALRTTAAARVASARRRRLDRRRAEARAAATGSGPADRDDLAPLIHEELGKLPDRYRTPLVLCDLEGLSHEDAARRLGVPVGTVKSRQARGRERLRGRLIRRGLAPAGLALAIDASAARAAVPAALTGKTIDVTMRFVEGAGATPGAVPAPAAAMLARKVMNAMLLSRLKVPGLALAAALATAAGAALLPRGVPARAEPAPVSVAGVPSDTPPEPGSLLQLHFVADDSRDAEAIKQARAGELAKPPEGYRWFRLAPGFGREASDGLVLRKDAPGAPDPAEWVLLKLDPQNVTERDINRVSRAEDDQGHPTILFDLTPDGGRRLGELTRSGLPEAGGSIRHRLAVVAEMKVVMTPVVNAEIRDAALISFGPTTPPGEVDALLAKLRAVAAQYAPPMAREAASQAEAIRQMATEDLPALAGADRVTIVRPNGYRIILRDPKRLAEFRAALTTAEVSARGEWVATVLFARGETMIREVQVTGDGAWGFVRPGTGWTLGRSEALRRLVQPQSGK